MKFDPKTMRLSVRMADHSSEYGAAVWTKARLISGGPAMLAGGSGATAKEARAEALANLASVESVQAVLDTASRYLASLEG